MRAQRRPGAAALRGCAFVLVSSWLLAAAADHTALIGGLLNAGEVDAVLPGFTVNQVLSNPSSIVGVLPTMGFSEECLSAIVTAIVTACLAEIQVSAPRFRRLASPPPTDAPGQFLPMLIIDPRVSQVILEYSEFLYLNAAASRQWRRTDFLKKCRPTPP